MKLSASKLKSLDYKQLAIDHGEKAVLGLIVLFVLFALIGTSWSRYERTPEELTQKVAAAEENIRKGVWPPEERAGFKPEADIRGDVLQLFTIVDVSKYDYTVDEQFTYRTRREKIREPSWLPVEDLVADYMRVILEINTAPQNDPSLLAGAEAGFEGAQPTRPQAGGEFELRSGGGLGGGEFGLRGGPTGPGGPGILPEAGGPGFDPAIMGAGEYGMAGMSGIEGEGFRSVAVRGIVPYRKQLTELANALHKPAGDMTLAEALQYVDFELERRRAVAGSEPWSEWERVQIETALDVLDKVSNFEEDIVDIGVTDPVLTMPLPQRVVGYWGNRVTHPRVRDFELTQEGRMLQSRMNDAMLEYAKQIKELQADQPQLRGFSAVQHNMRGLRAEMGSNDQYVTGMLQTFRTNYAMPEMGMQPGEINQQLKMKVTATGQLLLFRYLDFDVEPGNLYQYRVRMVLLNPNYQKSIDEIVSQEVAERPTRETEWSEPTAAVYVPDDVKYFLTNVGSVRGRPGISEAQFEIFQWYPDTGTYISTKVEREPGDRVGAKGVKTEVPAPPVDFAEKEVDFTSGDILVDVAPAPQIHPELHADLKPSSAQRAQQRLPDMALVIDEFGRLKKVDTISLAAAHTQEAQRKAAQDAAYERLKKKATEMEGAATDLAEFYDPAAAEEMERGSSRRSRNSIRRNRRGRGGDTPTVAPGGP